MRRGLRRAGADERGFGIPSVLILLVIVLIVAATAATLAITSLSETRRDRSSAEAFQIADSSVDLVGWHMNRYLTASETEGLLGVAQGVVQTDGCVEVSAGAWVLTIETNTSAGFCAAVSVPDLSSGSSTCYTQVRVGLDLTDPSALVNNLLTRNIVCQGEVNGVKRRILARMAVQINAGKPSTLWRREGWVECTSEFANLLDPTAGCPDLPSV